MGFFIAVLYGEKGTRMFQVIDATGDCQAPLLERYRVILRPCGHVLADLLEQWQAECLAESINDCNPRGRRRAEIQSYSATTFAAAAGGGQ